MNFSQLFSGSYGLVTAFVFWYPFIMALFWMAGSIFFIRTKEPKNDTLNFDEVN
ncbi:hypothetical protein [Planococcus halotolerans]|uniref:hypothetical protein n=1 Tax=Planococcus halotolerans TaxID=2233542 RepID=UPI001403151E|nr:hypothetical protein [Planococcus halotolerans]